MATHSVDKLKIITVLDSISIGLTYPFLSTHIQSLGADHVVVGILSVGYLLFNLISTSDMPFLENRGKRFNFIVALSITMLTHLSLAVINSYWYVILSRYLFGFVTNKTQYLCQDLLLENSEADKKEYTLTISSILSGIGYIIGPILAGYLFDYGFLYIGLLAVLLTFINICLAVSISHDSNILKDNSDKAVSNSVYQKISDTINDCINSNYKQDWDLMAIKFLHATCLTIFYGKFSQILKYNFQSSNIAVGYTYAYMNALVFASTYYFTTPVKEQYAQFAPVLLMERSFLFLCTCLFIACYSPVYALYMVMCIPIVFVSTFIHSTWTDLCVLRNDNSLNRLNEPLKITSAMTIPIVFGVICNVIGHHAVIMFSLIPLILSLGIIRRYTSTASITTLPKKEK